MFADEYIPIGTMIFKEDEYTRVLSKEDYNKLSLIQQKFIDTYSYFNNGFYKCSLDNDRFMNHSDIPNTLDIDDITIAN